MINIGFYSKKSSQGRITERDFHLLTVKSMEGERNENSEVRTPL